MTDRSIPDAAELARYAELVLDVGAALEPGQVLAVNGQLEHAWGSGIPSVFGDFRERTGGELAERGINRPAAHVDFMVGGPRVTVTGRARGGEQVTIIRDDAWQLPE